MQASRDKTDWAREVIARCQTLARFSEDEGGIRRTFLSAPMRDCHREIAGWVAPLGVVSSVDAAGNLRMLYPGAQPDAPRLMMGSHLDTVPNAGAYDGSPGVVLPLALLGALHGRKLPFAIEVVGFSEEEGFAFVRRLSGAARSQAVWMKTYSAATMRKESRYARRLRILA